MRKRANFVRAVARLQTECEARGITISTEAIEDLLVQSVTNGAAVLGVTADTFVRSYLPTVDMAVLAEKFRAAEEEGLREVDEAPPLILDLEMAGRLVASLAQAVRCVSLNHDVLAQGTREKWNTIGVLDCASNALTIIGAALGNVDVRDGEVSVLLSDEAVVQARRALGPTVENLAKGVWSFRNGPTLDEQVLKRMSADLALLPAG